MELGDGPCNYNTPAMVESLDTNTALPMLEHSVDLPLVPEKNSSSDDYVGNIELSHNTIEEGITQVAGVHAVAPITKKPKGDKLSLSPQGKVSEMHADSELKKLTGDEERQTEHGAVKYNSTISSALPVEIENLMPIEKDQESGMSEELPAGVRGDKQAIPESKKYEELETVKDVASQGGEGESNMITDATSPIDEAFAVSKSDKQLQNADSGEWMKVQVEQPQEEYVINNDEFTVVHEPDEEKEVIFEENEEDNVHQWITYAENKEVELEIKMESQEPEYTISNTENAQLPSETAEVEVPAGTHGSSEPIEEANQSGVSFTVSTPTTQMSNGDRNTVMETDMKLLEENKRLREMMGKLMEAGKGQPSTPNIPSSLPC
ncbi:hypothetical protein SLEP1_g2321 [Rubroshorea leprosula]|uniref:Uncharacterized protein n=1 Tax=Rubroshorea leprosula TaxID=152421 RepID=A0AAV5HQI3_9ROSI|nr:hypothetical protein SLEP1_g2321 [Rubroshorea leprosula]